MLDEKDDRSFWLELEAASKGLTIAADKSQAERLKQLFEELAAQEPSDVSDQISTRTS